MAWPVVSVLVLLEPRVDAWPTKDVTTRTCNRIYWSLHADEALQHIWTCIGFVMNIAQGSGYWRQASFQGMGHDYGLIILGFSNLVTQNSVNYYSMLLVGRYFRT